MWKLRAHAVGGQIPADTTVNLVYRQKRTSDHPRSDPADRLRAGEAGVLLADGA
jgi:hypothetical protein